MSFLNLKNFWQSIKRDRYLLAALFLGLALRGLNSTFGSPSLYISNDEAIAHLSAFNMIANKTPISIANYTPLGAYIQIPFLVASFLIMKILGLVSNAGDFGLFVLTREGYFLFVPRLISAFFGTVTILVVYKLTFLLFKEKKAAIISAFLTAVSFNLVHISHFGRPWSAALFFFILAVYFSLKNKSLLSYLAIALSYGFHQVGILGIPLVFWSTKKKTDYKNLLGLLSIFIAIFVFNNLTLKIGLVNAISRDQSFLKMGKFAADVIIGSPDLLNSLIKSLKENLSLYFIQNLFVTDGILLLGILGIIKKFNSQKDTRIIIIYIAAYFVFASLFFHPLMRYLLPIILLLIPFVAFAINSLLRRWKLVIILILFLASINSIWWNFLFFKKPTFIQVHDWINQNVPKDIPIAYVGGRYRTFAPSKESIIHTQSISKNYSEVLLLTNPSYDLENVRKIIYVSNFPGENKLNQFLNATANYQIKYIVDYYLEDSDRLYNQNTNYFEIIAQFKPRDLDKLLYPPDSLFDPRLNFPYPPSKIKFSMFSLKRIGPYFDILQIK